MEDSRGPLMAKKRGQQMASCLVGYLERSLGQQMGHLMVYQMETLMDPMKGFHWGNHLERSLVHQKDS